jgi:hypothetical protein
MQKPYYEVLLGMPDQLGARRAWVDMPLGYGKQAVVAEAIQTLFGNAAIKHVLYVTHACCVRSISQEIYEAPTQIVDRNPTGTPTFEGVTICTDRQWCLGHDTWVKYGGYDLVVIDLCMDPPIYGSKTRQAAMRTTMGLPNTRAWLVGGPI